MHTPVLSKMRIHSRHRKKMEVLPKMQNRTEKNIFRRCPYQPNVICERKHCYPNCPYRIKAIRKHTKYTLPICTLPQPCKFKGQDKKTKLPICKYYDKQTGKLLPCNNQLIISKAWLARHKPDMKTLRKLWYKYKKAGVI